MGYVAGEGKFEISGKEPLGQQKSFEKNFWEICVENTYVVSRYHRGDWYI